MRVEIHGAGDHRVIINGKTDDLDALVERAAKLFEDTRPAESKTVVALGFSVQEVIAPDRDARDFDEVTLTVGRSDA